MFLTYYHFDVILYHFIQHVSRVQCRQHNIDCFRCGHSKCSFMVNICIFALYFIIFALCWEIPTKSTLYRNTCMLCVFKTQNKIHTHALLFKFAKKCMRKIESIPFTVALTEKLWTFSQPRRLTKSMILPSQDRTLIPNHRRTITLTTEPA